MVDLASQVYGDGSDEQVARTPIRIVRDTVNDGYSLLFLKNCEVETMGADKHLFREENPEIYS